MKQDPKTWKGSHRNASHAGWYMFRTMCQYKSRLYGSFVQLVDRFFPSTQTCSSCGHVFTGKDKLTTKDRTYNCPSCGLSLDRDLNAAKNILAEGLRVFNNNNLQTLLA